HQPGRRAGLAHVQVHRRLHLHRGGARRVPHRLRRSHGPRRRARDPDGPRRPGRVPQRGPDHQPAPVPAVRPNPQAVDGAPRGERVRVREGGDDLHPAVQSGVVVVSNAPARLVLDIYSSAFGYLDTVAAPAWVTCSIRWNGIDTASFALESDDRLNALLGVPGRRMVVRYRPEALLPDTVDLLSGAIYTQQGDADPRSSVRTYHVSGDFCLLDQLLGWPNPTGTISQQGDDEAFYEATGPAETAALSLINLNRARSVTPITVAASG